MKGVVLGRNGRRDTLFLKGYLPLDNGCSLNDADWSSSITGPDLDPLALNNLRFVKQGTPSKNRGFLYKFVVGVIQVVAGTTGSAK